MDEKDLKNKNKDNKEEKFSELTDIVSSTLNEIDERYDESNTEETLEEGVISAPAEEVLPGQNITEPEVDINISKPDVPSKEASSQIPVVPTESTEGSSGVNDIKTAPELQLGMKQEDEISAPAGFGSMNIEVEDEEAKKIADVVDSQVEDNKLFQANPKQKAEINVISTTEEKADRYKDTSIREEVKKKELVVTPRKKKAVRTYRDFAIENAKTGGGSLANMIMAEREKDSEKKRKSATNPKNVFISLLSVVFVVLGIGGIIAAYFVVVNKQEDIKTANSIIITPNPQITAEFSKEIYEPDINFRKLTDGFENDYEGTATPIGSIKQVYFTTSSGESLKFLVNTNKFLETLRTRTPSSLLRTFSDDFTLGIYSTVENSQFLLFKVSSYPTAVEGMLDWENEIVLDLDPVMKVQQVEEVRKRFFEDIILFNKDTRAILDSEGNIAFAYSFIDRQTLVIFKDKNTLKEVVSRLQNTIKR